MRAFRLAYDGRAFYGFQRQPDVPTVEGALLETLEAGGVVDDGETPPGYAAAGRTDAGVSAVAQTVAFGAPDWCTPAALNGRLPGSIRAWAAAAVPDEFHATHSASRRTYTYHLHAPDADDAAASEAANRLAGEHDFHNLTSDERGTVRNVTLRVKRDGEFLVVTVSAGGFPREFVRRLVGVLTEVAVDGQSLARVDEVLSDESLQGGTGVPRMPPEPLVLTGVTYPDVEFSVDEEAVESAHGVFGQRRVSALERVRVAETVLSGLGE
ncbi:MULTISPECIES: tRNA pseudouridine(38-40) synthase TruA [Halolamina]|uniref:tRNA pseudouridine synthase A n=1 Tax=Halolamina pelagica TaxID=699431 RepID=A0A1I5PZ73_9EURY|nr:MULTISPECIES: tRNA pseudouridine(38-40) synthase TruA [Halolamina]NHX35020.1 tRNA pseudouridine(38-40) synthase TruA [Halolamina sp. R1-12]SFP39247.1 tRNA pseudouridine38-40 synthase [Halolamina pelagica]